MAPMTDKETDKLPVPLTGELEMPAPLTGVLEADEEEQD